MDLKTTFVTKLANALAKLTLLVTSVTNVSKDSTDFPIAKVCIFL